MGSPCWRFGLSCARASVQLSRGPNSLVPSPSFNRSPTRTVRTHAEIVARTSPPISKPAPRPPLQVPAHPHLPCLAHFASAHSPKLRAPTFQARRSFPVARSPEPESAAGRARPPSATVLRHRQAQPRHHSRPTRGEFPRRAFFSPPPPFSLSRRLVAGDRRYRYRAVEPRPPGQPQPPRAFFARAELPGSGHGARAVLATKVDGGPNKEEPPVSLPLFPRSVSLPGGPRPSARARDVASTRALYR
jgi:hypothetical protein